MSLTAVSVESGPDGYVRFWPRTQRTGKRGVYLARGAQGVNAALSAYVDPTNYLPEMLLASRIAGEGITCVAGPLGTADRWANDTSVTETETAFTAIKAMGCATDSFIGVGVSAGHGAMLRYAIDNPTKIAACVGIVPLIDLVGIYTANSWGYQAAIGTAWGVTPPAALPARANLMGSASGLAGKPWLLGYSTADTLTTPSAVSSLATTIGVSCTTTIVSTTLDHSQATVQAFVDLTIPDAAYSSLIAFLIGNGA